MDFVEFKFLLFNFDILVMGYTQNYVFIFLISENMLHSAVFRFDIVFGMLLFVVMFYSGCGRDWRSVLP